MGSARTLQSRRRPEKRSALHRIASSPSGSAPGWPVASLSTAARSAANGVNNSIWEGVKSHGLAQLTAKVKTSAPTNSTTAETMVMRFIGEEDRFYEFWASSFSQVRPVTLNRVKRTSVTIPMPHCPPRTPRRHPDPHHESEKHGHRARSFIARTAGTTAHDPRAGG